jgi:V/A-type H+-transporting ATPase subunit A
MATETLEITLGKVTGIIANLIIAKTDGHVAQNEICRILVGEERLLGEVIKVQGDDIFIQCYESTRGMRVGNDIEFTGDMLEVTLGPGMLSKTYDGLQNDLNKFEELFLKRGDQSYALDEGAVWSFKPLVKTGDSVQAGDWLGEVKEKGITLKIMVPLKQKAITQ